MTESELFERKGGLDAFWLKIIAIAGMLFDHIGIVFGDMMPLPVKCLFYMPGGLTYPIMAFMMTEGFRHTRDVKRYMGRLLLFALITQPVYTWAFRAWAVPGVFPILNILFTLALGLGMIMLSERMTNRPLFIIVLAAVSAVTSILFDWGLVGAPLVYAMHALRKRDKNVTPAVIVVVAALVLITLLNVLAGGFILSARPENALRIPMVWQEVWASSHPSLFFIIGSVAAIFFLARYNGGRGRNMRYFFYAFYPGHILLLALIRGLFFGDWALLP